MYGERDGSLFYVMAELLAFAIAMPLLAFGAVLVVEYRRGKHSPSLLITVAMLAIVFIILLAFIISGGLNGNATPKL